MKGGKAEFVPFAPRLDLWYNANNARGTLPDKYRDMSADDIAKSEGWALHKVNPEYQKVSFPHENCHWGIGLLFLKESVFSYKFSDKVDIEIQKDGNRQKIRYSCPLGQVSSTVVYSPEMEKAGISNYYIEEYIIKKPEDYSILGYIFETLELIPEYDNYQKWQKKIGEDGVAVAFGGRAASPMHHIQKYFLDPMAFYFHYNDYPNEMRYLSSKLEIYFEKSLQIIAGCPGEVILWGTNYDEMLTYPPYFEKEILPWLKKASAILNKSGKLLLSHCDGENEGLIDLIYNSGINVAEAVCPYPMTKVKIDEYYKRWNNKIAIFGGIPSSLLLSELTTDNELDQYLDFFIKSVNPGKGLIVGIADNTPPDADFDRLRKIQEILINEL